MVRSKPFWAPPVGHPHNLIFKTSTSVTVSWSGSTWARVRPGVFLSRASRQLGEDPRSVRTAAGLAAVPRGLAAHNHRRCSRHQLHAGPRVEQRTIDVLSLFCLPCFALLFLGFRPGLVETMLNKWAVSLGYYRTVSFQQSCSKPRLYHSSVFDSASRTLCWSPVLRSWMRLANVFGSEQVQIQAEDRRASRWPISNEKCQLKTYTE